MALTDSIMSLFGRPSTPQASPSVVATQQATVADNPTVPSASTPKSTGNPPAFPPAGTGDKSPNANFEDLWKADPNNPEPVTPSLVPTFNLDPKGLMEAASKVNFTQGLPEELVTKAMGGDRAAFLDVINKAVQLGYANATATSSEIIKNSLGSAQTVLTDKVLPASFRAQQVDQALSEANPVFNDPAVSPILGMLKERLASKYPTASPAEIAQFAAGYLDSMAGKIVTASGGSVVSRTQQGTNPGFRPQAETDWETFFAG